MDRLFFENLPRDTVLYGRYAVQRVLKANDAGAVYLCEDTLTATPIVLKIAAAENPKDPWAAQRFQNEVALSRSVSHPHVVAADQFLYDEQFLAYTMRYIPGSTLGDWMRSHRRVPLAKALRLLSQIAGALAAIHAARIIHRDLTPSNIIIGPGEVCYVIDFGLSNLGSIAHGSTGGEIRGTPDYLPPEFIVDGSYDEASDLFSLGLISFELLTGDIPGRNLPLLDALTSRAQRDLPPVESLRHDILPEVASMINNLVQRKPAKRTISARELKRALQVIIGRQTSHGLERQRFSAITSTTGLVSAA